MKSYNLIENVDNKKAKEPFFGYLAPQFLTKEFNSVILQSDQKYTVLKTDDLIKKELTKKEAKTFK